MKLKLSVLNDAPEIFYSIQGEGKSMGKAVVFLRTSHCNLHCHWCDTDYTWNWEGTPYTHKNDKQTHYNKFKQNEWSKGYEIEDLIPLIHQHPTRRLVLTGGEPMMQQKALVDLIEKLQSLDPDYRFEIETNGTYIPSTIFDSKIEQYNVSPKLANSNNPLKIRLKEKAMAFYANSPKANFKFVVQDLDKDLEEVVSLTQSFNISPSKVYLMPEGKNAEELLAKHASLIEICKTYGFNFSTRLHVLVYGDKVGV